MASNIERVGRRACVAVLCVFSLLLGPPPDSAAAEEPPAPGWFLPVGAAVGASIDVGETARCAHGAGFVLGGEASAAYLWGTSWTGAYLDGSYDFGASTTQASLGLEAGWFVLGAELGYVAELDAQDVYHGVRVGALLSVGLATGFVRWRAMLRSHDTHVLELGVLLKWPFALGGR